MGKSKIILFLLGLPLVLLAILNFFLVFTPEMGFDALWYHLTLPKLWLLKHQWYFPGGLLYYSVMPRLSELLFIPLIKYTGTIGPKLLQYLAGLGTSFIIWQILGRFKQSPVMKMVGISLFYATWLVSWQSGSAYIDLIRTLFEVLALYFLLHDSWKVGGLFLGLAIGTKWLALGSLAIYALIFGPSLLFPALLISLPWFFLAYYFTGNPVYPLFSDLLHHSFSNLGDIIRHLFWAPFYLTRPFDDFISPLVGLLFIFACFALLSPRQTTRRLALVAVLGSLSSLVLDPPSSRFTLPYLPALAIVSVLFLQSWSPTWLKKTFVFLVITSGFFILVLRLLAFQKYLPFFTGRLDQTAFLVVHYDRLPGTFLDPDRFVENLPTGAKILVDKLHNLYYFPRDFDHTSWITSWADYDFLVTIGEKPQNIKGSLVHTNAVGIQVFKLK